MKAQPRKAKAQYFLGARLAAQVGAPFDMCAPPTTPVKAQPEIFAFDWDEKNANVLLKLASRARFSELTGNKIRKFVAYLDFYLRLCARLKHN